MMLRSMTAYGRHSVNTEAGVFNWELRSVNNRYLETAVRLPEEMRELESKIRDTVATRISRGKVEVWLRRHRGSQSRQNNQAGNADAPSLYVDTAVLESLSTALTKIQAVVPNTSPPNPLELLQWPGVLKAATVNVDVMHKQLLDGFTDALADCVAMREREGAATAVLLRARVAQIRQCINQLREHRPDVLNRQRSRLKAKLAELDIPADSQRLEQELVYVAQRLDIDEELDRLAHHLVEVESVLERRDPVGRRLDFLMQELNREANTLASKSSDSDTTGASVNVKVLIEQMREQVQNLE